MAICGLSSECSLEERGNGGGHTDEGRDVWWRLHLGEIAIGTISKPELLDCGLDRHVSAAQEAARERMSPQEQQVEDQNGKTEVVVFGRPNNSAEGTSLQFRRCE